MNPVRSASLMVGMLVLTGPAGAQLPGLPGGVWQTGIGYFVPAPQQNGPAVYCIELGQVLKYGYPWSAFLTPISPNDATPTGYTYDGYGGQCASQVTGAYLITGLVGGGFNALGSGPGSTQFGAPQFGALEDLDGDWQSPTFGAYYALPQPPPPPNPEPPIIQPPTNPPLTPVVTPEPGTWILMATGLVAVLGFVAVKGIRVS